VLRRAAVDVATALHQNLGIHALDSAVASTEPTAKREKHQLLVLLLRAGNNEERALLRLNNLGRVSVHRDGGAAVAVGRWLLAVELRLVAVGDGLEHRVAGSGSAECRERVGRPVPRGGAERVCLFVRVHDLDHFAFLHSCPWSLIWLLASPWA